MIASLERFIPRPFRRPLYNMVRNRITRIQYNLLSRMDTDGAMAFLNYGYAHLDPGAERIALAEEDEENRYFIQLYHHVVTAVSLDKPRMLEIGCGRGGGAAYVMGYLKPESLTGVDVSSKSIDFCANRYAIEGLSFRMGNAEKLRFQDESFDAIVNIESSHCYVHIDRFFREVRRLLRPNGHFLFADLRGKESLGILRDQLQASGLELLKEEDITPNVMAALDLDSDRKERLIDEKVPDHYRERVKFFAAVKGTEFYESFQRGDVVYISYALRKKGN